jgi:exonuclease SbcD
MRLLHTSDWHVGRTFHGRDLLADQEIVLGAIAELVAAERVDVVVVSGDLYDRAVPSAEAVATCTRALSAIRRAGAELVIIAGNHDSAQRLGAFAEFAAAGGLHLRTSVAELDRPVLLRDEYGLLACYGIPYLEPDPARHALGRPELRGHAGVLGEAMNRVRADLAERGPDVRSVVLAHAFVTGAAPSESERTIAVGGVEDVPAAVFDGVDYVALGHLHGAQTLARRPGRRSATRASGTQATGHGARGTGRAVGRSGERERRRLLPVRDTHGFGSSPGCHAQAARTVSVHGSAGLVAGRRIGTTRAALFHARPR